MIQLVLYHPQVLELLEIQQHQDFLVLQYLLLLQAAPECRDRQTLLLNLEVLFDQQIQEYPEVLQHQEPLDLLVILVNHLIQSILLVLCFPVVLHLLMVLAVLGPQKVQVVQVDQMLQPVLPILGHLLVLVDQRVPVDLERQELQHLLQVLDLQGFHDLLPVQLVQQDQVSLGCLVDLLDLYYLLDQLGQLSQDHL